MKIQALHFGEIEVEESNIITFQKGILGFEEYKKYVLLPADEKGETPFFFLQSIEEEQVNFFLLDTFSFFKDYDLQIDDGIVEKLGIEKPEDVVVLTTITVRNELKNATTNLKAPLVINHKKQLGIQLVLDEKNYVIKQPLFLSNEKAEVGQVWQMLVLGRKKGESIIINDEIEITVTAVEGELVKLGINAPRHIAIHRKEVYLEIQEENKLATASELNLVDILKIKK